MTTVSGDHVHGLSVEPPPIDPAFTVENPPAPAPKKKVGRENESDKAVLFCSVNVGLWCKCFGYSFTNSQTLHGAHQTARQRKTAMRRIAEGYGLAIEFTQYTDQELATVFVYAKVTERESIPTLSDGSNGSDG
jgi:hypothetical protein